MHLKSVEEHNRETIAAREAYRESCRKTGVACPACGEELLWPGHGEVEFMPLVHPWTKRQARCPRCAVKVNLEK